MTKLLTQVVPCCNLKYLGLLIKGFSDSTPVQLTQQEKRALGSEKNIMVRDVTY